MRPDIYKSIDELPIWNWSKIHETGNLSYLKKLSYYRGLKEDDSIYLNDNWEIIYNEYLEVFGLSEKYKRALTLKSEIVELKKKYILTDKRVLINSINILEDELQSVSEDDSQGISIIDGVAIISKNMGFRNDQKKISVLQYYSDLERISKENKRNGRAN